MFIHIIADSPAKVADLQSKLVSRYTVSSALLNSGKAALDTLDAVIVAIDLRIPENISALREQLGKPRTERKRIFIIEQRARILNVRAYALGATSVLIAPVGQIGLLAALSNAADVAATKTLSGSEAAASAGALAISSMFSDVLANRPINVAAVEGAARMIVENIAEGGLSDWLQAVRQHHEGTFQHCLLVTGIAVDFGLWLGMPRADVRRLYLAAMLHDVGKAKIPLVILDKPGRLDRDERILIETHPMAGYEALKGSAGISAEILDAVLHHHEYLDGSGYPDGLCDGRICDLVRLLTISDIFAALANDLIKHVAATSAACSSMRGKLEAPLVAAFKEVALSR